MDFYRYALILVVGLLGYFSLAHGLLAGARDLKARKLHRYFALYVLLIAFHDACWLGRLSVAVPSIAHSINMFQWFLTWAAMMVWFPFLELYQKNRIGKLSYINAVLSFLFIVILVIFPRSYYHGLPRIVESIMPWGESVRILEYQGLFGFTYYCSIGYAIIVPFFFLVILVRNARKFSLRNSNILIVCMALIVVAIIHDIAIDFIPGIPVQVRLYHMANVLLVLAMNWVLLDDATRTREMQVQLESSRAELLVLNEEQESLLQAASHDLRTPLVSIQGYSRELGVLIDSCLESCEAGVIPEKSVLQETKQSLGYITQAVKRMDSLLHGLITVTRSGRSPMQLSIVKLESIFDIKQKFLQIESNLPTCLADPAVLAQVVEVILDNAMLYRKAEGSLLVRVTSEMRDGRVFLHIEDNGIGMLPALIPNIFRLFHRLNPRDGKGLGVGLTLARRLMHRMGGEISASSELGVGSVFTLELRATT